MNIFHTIFTICLYETNSKNDVYNLNDVAFDSISFDKLSRTLRNIFIT